MFVYSQINSTKRLLTLVHWRFNDDRNNNKVFGLVLDIVAALRSLK